MPRVTATIPAELEAALKERAHAEDRSESAIVRRVLAERLTSPLNQAVTAPLERASSQAPTERGDGVPA